MSSQWYKNNESLLANSMVCRSVIRDKILRCLLLGAFGLSQRRNLPDQKCLGTDVNANTVRNLSCVLQVGFYLVIWFSWSYQGLLYKFLASFFFLLSCPVVVDNTGADLRKITGCDSAHALLQKRDVAAQEGLVVTTPEICFEAILRVSSIRTQMLFKGVARPSSAGRSVVLSEEDGYGTQLSCSWWCRSTGSPVCAENITVSFYRVSPSRSETAVRSHITKSMLTGCAEAFLSYYARWCLTASHY